MSQSLFRSGFIRIFTPMKDSVTDIPQMFKFLYGEIKSMKEIIESQSIEITRLQKENEELRQKLSKYEKPDKDSTNSSIPPSQETIKSKSIRRTNSLREKSDRLPGGQLGHTGTTRIKINNPDIIDVHISNYCFKCGTDLSNMESELKYTTQEIDLPIIKPIVTEHRHYSITCSCGCENLSESPRGRGGNSVFFGKRINALTTYLNVVQYMPYQRLQSFYKDIFNLKLSQGTISNIIQKVNEKASDALYLIKQHISTSKVVGFDESGCFCQERLDWSWIAQTPYATLVFRALGRGSKVLEDMFGESLKDITAVTDRHSAYFKLDFDNHQICMAHILREIKYLDELDTTQSWSKKMWELIRDAIHERNKNPNLCINPKPWLEKLDKLLNKNLDKLKIEFSRLKKGLTKYRDYIFNFLKDPSIPPDNNASERGIRKLKTKQKISGTFRSNQGADAFMALHSITDTAYKNGQSPHKALLALL